MVTSTATATLTAFSGQRLISVDNYWQLLSRLSFPRHSSAGHARCVLFSALSCAPQWVNNNITLNPAPALPPPGLLLTWPLPLPLFPYWLHSTGDWDCNINCECVTNHRRLPVLSLPYTAVAKRATGRRRTDVTSSMDPYRSYPRWCHMWQSPHDALTRRLCCVSLPTDCDCITVSRQGERKWNPKRVGNIEIRNNGIYMEFMFPELLGYPYPKAFELLVTEIPTASPISIGFILHLKGI